MVGLGGQPAVGREEHSESAEVDREAVCDPEAGGGGSVQEVKENQGGPGVDGCTIEEFESELRDRLYVTWNRMSSGSYVPPPVKVVKIPKPHGGGMRMLGVPTGQIEWRRRSWPRSWRRWWSRSPTVAPMGIGRAARRWMRWRYVGSGVLRTRGCWIVTSPGSLTTFRMISSSKR